MKLILFTLLYSLSAYANSSSWNALVVGGGCEDPKTQKENQFTKTFQFASQVLPKLGWKIEVQFDGNQWPSPVHGGQNQNPSTKKSLFDSLDTNLKNLSGIKGSQFLLLINTHGSQPPEHRICLGDGTMMNVSELKPYLQKMKQAGIEVAVFDNSCYSGQSINQLQDSGVCVMSATNATTVGYGSRPLANFLGSVLPPGDEVMNYNGKQVYQRRPVGMVAPDSKGNVSAIKAFEWMKLTTNEPQFPRSTDCNLSEEEALSWLEHMAPLFVIHERLSYDSSSWFLKDEFQNAHEFSCQSEEFQKSFETLNQISNFIEKENKQEALKTSQSEVSEMLGIKVDLKKSFSKVQKFLSKEEFYEKWNTLADQADRELSREGTAYQKLLSQGLYTDLKNLLQDHMSDMQSIQESLKQVLFVACKMKKQSSGNELQTPCERFTLRSGEGSL